MEEKNIIRDSSKDIRAIARKLLQGNWGQASLAAFIVTICVGLPMMLVNTVQDSGVITFVMYVLMYAIQAAFSLGLSIYFLRLIRSEDKQLSDIFSGFERIIKAFLLLIRMIFFIFLWSLLFIIPGIIAAYKYSLSYYILADHPEYSSKECMEESKRLTDGNKARMFFLEFSFIGWYILLAIVTLIIGTLFGMSSSVSMMAMSSPTDTVAIDVSEQMIQTFTIKMMFVFALSLIPVSVLSAYVSTATTVLYDMIIGRIKTTIEYDAPIANDGIIEAEATVEKTEDVVESKSTDVGFKSVDDIVEVKETTENK